MKKKKKDILWEEEERNTSSGATGNKNVTFYGATRSEITSHLQSVGQGEIINFWGCTGLSCRFLSLLPCSLSPHGSCLLFQQEAGQVHSAADPSLWHSLHHVCFLPWQFQSRSEDGLWARGWVIPGKPPFVSPGLSLSLSPGRSGTSWTCFFFFSWACPILLLYLCGKSIHSSLASMKDKFIFCLPEWDSLPSF